MALYGSVTAISLLLFTAFTQDTGESGHKSESGSQPGGQPGGFQAPDTLLGEFGMLDRSYSVNASVAQRVNLSCQLDEEHSYKITQIEWRKMEARREKKIAIYNPSLGSHYYWKNVSMSLEKPGGELRGSVLELQEVNVWDSGIYDCELITFPHGTVKVQTHLRVTDAPVSARVLLWPNRAVREGDDVTILCTSTPPSGTYSLWPSQNKSSILKSEEGRFTLPNVTRDDSDLYICQPSDPSFHHYSATVKVTVNYLDEIECDTLRSIEVKAGQEITVTCAANASQNSQYTWRKGNVTVSTSDSLHLRSVSRQQAGVYVLTAVFNDTDLQRQTEFNITVQTDSGDLTASKAPPTSTTTNGNSHVVTRRRTAVSTATEESLASPVTYPSAQTTNSSGTARLFSTGHAHPLDATLPPFENNGTDFENASSHGQPAATPSYGASVTAMTRSRNITSDVGVTKIGPRDSGQYVVFIVLPILLLLLVIMFLYRRHMVLRKMDMPPPFKPPPPPVKYTSAKTQDACVMIQQPRNSGTQ